MKKHCRVASASIVWVVLCLFSAERASAAVETWTSQSGTQIQAEFVEMSDAGMVTLRSAEGERFQIAATALNEAGQERVRDLAAKQRAARLAEARRAGRQLRAIIPEAYIQDSDTVLARFESRNVTGIVYQPSGRMDLFIKENNQYLSPPVRFAFSVRYNRPDPRRAGATVTRSRSFVEWIEPPVFRDNTARFRMRVEHGVEAELVYAFRADGADMSYQVIDPDGIQYPSARSHMTASFPAIFHEDRNANPPRYFSPRFPQGAERAAFFKAMDNFEVRSGTGGRASGRRVPYNQGARSVASGNWIEVGGGVYGPHTLRIERPRRGGSLSSYIYRDNMPAQGWTMYFRRSGHSNAIQAADMLSVSVTR